MNTSQSLESRFWRIHQAIYEATGGAIGHRLIGVPTLLLTTTDQRTGKRRTAALVYAKRSRRLAHRHRVQRWC